MCENTPFYDLNGDGKVDFTEREIEFDDFMQMTAEEERSSLSDGDEDEEEEEDGFGFSDDSDGDSSFEDDF